MSADIWETTINGQNIIEAVYNNDPSWHRLGKVWKPSDQKRVLDSETTIVEGNLGWSTSKQPMGLLNYAGHPVKDHYALIRDDNQDTLAVVGNRYVELQNRQAFSFLDSLLMDGIMEYEAAFALRGGKEVCLLARMPNIDWIVPGQDAILRYILFNLPHGYGTINILPTATRVVCANTQQLALREGKSLTWSIRHTGDLNEKLEDARDYISQFDKLFTNYREDAQKLLVGCTQKQRAEYLAELFPAPEDDDTDRAKANHAMKIAEVKATFAQPAQQMPGIRGTWWAAVNAVTGTIDHGKGRKTRDERRGRENKFLRVMNGDGAALKERALSLALEMAA